MANPTKNLPVSPVVAPANPNSSAASNNGMEAASNAGTLGLSTAVIHASIGDSGFSGAVSPIKHQYIGWGGDSTVSGQEAADVVNVKLVRYTDTDFNDEPCALVAANQQAVDGAVFFTVGSIVNHSGQTIEVGEVTVGATAVA